MINFENRNADNIFLCAKCQTGTGQRGVTQHGVVNPSLASFAISVTTETWWAVVDLNGWLFFNSVNGFMAVSATAIKNIILYNKVLV